MIHCKAKRVLAALAAVFTALILGAAPGVRPAGASADDDYAPEIRAAIVYNMLQFVSWPKDVEGNGIVLGVVCPTEGATDFESVEHQPVRKGKLVVRRLEDPPEVEECQAVYFQDCERETLEAFLEKAGETAVLTIGEGDLFLESGGMIRLFRSGSKIRFSISKEAADRARIKISSQLMKMARPPEERSE